MQCDWIVYISCRLGVSCVLGRGRGGFKEGGFTQALHIAIDKELVLGLGLELGLELGSSKIELIKVCPLL